MKKLIIGIAILWAMAYAYLYFKQNRQVTVKSSFKLQDSKGDFVKTLNSGDVIKVAKRDNRRSNGVISAWIDGNYFTYVNGIECFVPEYIWDVSQTPAQGFNAPNVLPAGPGLT